MAWWKAVSVTVQATENVVAVNAGDDIAGVFPGDALLVGSNPPVEIKKAYIDLSNNKYLELVDPWPYSTETGQPAKAINTGNSLVEAVKVLREVGDLSTEFYGNVLEFLTSNADTVTFTANNQNYTVKSYNKLISEVDALTP